MNARIAAAETAIREGRREDAIDELTAVLTEAPDQLAETYLTLGRQLYLAGRFRDAERCTARALDRHPGAFALWNLQGVLMRVLRRPDEALAALDRAVALQPEEIGPRVNRGSVLLDLGRAGEARAAFAELLAREPGNPMHLSNLGRAESALGETAAAQAHVRQALALKRDYAEAWLQLADLAGGRYSLAEEILEEGLEACPDHPKLLEAKALTLRASGQLSWAQAFLEALEPRMPDAGWLQFHLGDLVAESDRARGNLHLRRAVALEPQNLDHLVGLIQSLERTTSAQEGAALDEAYGLSREALALGGLRPGHSKVLRDLFTRVCAFDAADALGDFATVGRGWARAGLHTALFRQIGRVRTPQDRLELMQQHRLWGQAAEARAAAAPIVRAPRAPGDGRIRLGFMSSDLRRHPVSFFALPLFDHIDASRFEVFCYSFFQGQEDELQARIAGQVAAFRWMPEINARDAAQVIADDGLDMLIELGGSTLMNKIEVMAYRPAPVQASWLGYPHSAGLQAIDYFICDPLTAPADPELLLERPLMMPRTWIAFGEEVFEGHPEIAPGLPEDRAGVLTFGTANAPHKFNREVLRTWARVVAAVPGARFAVIRPEAGSAVFRANVTAEFAAAGVAEDRLVFHAVRGRHMPLYNEVDISLDAFPLTGGTTTAEALWMGVPVVSLRGPAFHERLSASILANAGLGDLVADDVEGFVRVALDLAADRPRRVALRQGLRDQIRQGPLGQGEAFARDFYDLVAAAVGRGG
ncbi:MAG TPA: tetratricopeptide repeat protein [Phenylobacterium sp.]|uniref:O-linked N-acetylglucosamine transferase, SPINDLY family protein n=1 Tax=Phenylobacterium sp. TaxID=1871053 RepID=UPI002D313A50|nr:tetratricopeptide repeat protein [Phenylobacterium sp.]HZZ66764.1 tetratricopeptide repeat protein [Phenylobacterium sp.]